MARTAPDPRHTSSQRGYEIAYRFPSPNPNDTLEDFLAAIRPYVQQCISTEVGLHTPIHVSLVVRVKVKSPDGSETEERSLLSKRVVVAHRLKIKAAIDSMFADVEAALEVTEGQGSGWTWYGVLEGFLNSRKTRQRAGAAATAPDLTYAIKKKDAVLVLNASDDRCFERALTAWEELSGSRREGQDYRSGQAGVYVRAVHHRVEAASYGYHAHAALRRGRL